METQNPYSSPTAEAMANTDETYSPQIFSASGRIGRLRYICYSMLINIVLMVVLGILAAVLIPALASAGDTGQGVIMAVIMVLFYIPSIVVAFILAKRRLNDLNQSGWLSLLLFVPLLNFFFALYLLVWPGTKGSNNHGPAPERNSTLLIVGGILVPFAIVGILAAVAIPAYNDYLERAKSQAPSEYTTP